MTLQLGARENKHFFSNHVIAIRLYLKCNIYKLMKRNRTSFLCFSGGYPEISEKGEGAPERGPTPDKYILKNPVFWV
jgi:hypothetical protein